MRHITETTLQWLRFAEQNLRDIAAKMAEEPDPTVRVLAAHALRYLAQAGQDVDAALDEAAGAAVEERYGLTPAGTAALVAAGLARDRTALQAAGPTAPLLA
jgi:hypothetical protein